MVQVKSKKIFNISNEILLKCGLPAEDAAIVSDTILDAHKKGKHTHGLGRLQIYSRKIDEGWMAPVTDLKQIKNNAAVAVYDAQNGFGQVAANKGMDICTEKAKEYGIGAVAIKNSNSFGIAGYYGEIAVKKGLIGIVMGNASPAIVTPGGKKSIMGTNPISYAFPGTKNHPPVIYDIACSVVARSKIRQAVKNGESIPKDWAVDAEGNPTDDPVKAIDGMLNAIGGYKGFGLALTVDILAGLLSGSAFGGEVKALNAPKGFSRYGFFLMAIDPKVFLEEEEYTEKMDQLIDNVKSCGEPGEVYLPGERSYLMTLRNSADVGLNEKIINEVNELALKKDIAIRL